MAHVIDIPHQLGLALQAGLDHTLEPEVEHIMQVHVAQHDPDRTPLWSPLLVRMNLSIFQNGCFQPLADQADHARIANPMLHETDQPIVTERVEEGSNVGVENPVHLRASNRRRKRVQRIVLATLRSEPVREPEEVLARMFATLRSQRARRL